MSSPAKQPAASAPEVAETESHSTTVPIWLVLAMFVLLYWGAIYFDMDGGWFNAKVYAPYRTYDQLADYVPRTEGPDLRRGQRLFENVCAVCHGTDGAGKPGQAPPLAGSEWVNAKGVNRLVRIPVLGLTGPIEVKNQTYNIGAGMTAVAPNSSRDKFTDADLASVLSYIRHSWGNTGGDVTEAEVKAIRDDIGTRTKQLSVDELKTLSEVKK